jgi:hypothetical protein
LHLRFDLKSLGRLLIVATLSLLLGGISYFLWMATFLLTSKINSPIIETSMWILAPVITAFGFALGVLIFERYNKTSATNFLNIYRWPLIGCAIGAISVYWYGPMLIVFTMLLAGELSILLREILNMLKESED